jgi:hypothetical protein
VAKLPVVIEPRLFFVRRFSLGLAGRKLANRRGFTDLTLTEAALRARRARLGHALVAGRTARKPASRFNRLLERRLGTRPG